MVKYYYDKYNTNTVNASEPKSWTFNHSGQTAFQGTQKGIHWTGGQWQTNYGAGQWVAGDQVYIGNVFYSLSGNFIYKYIARSSGKATDYVDTDAYYAEAYEPPVITYTRGSLVQANIIAENGTYPTNGRHTDGYWYVRGSVANTAPTTPGAFTNPTGDLEIGDAKNISWGASTDAEGGTLTYELGVSINGGAYTVLGTTTNRSYNYTIPTATSLKFRVRTQDSGGLWSSYRESALFTVTKPKYYYSKYNNATVDNGYWGLNETFQRSDSFNAWTIGTQVTTSITGDNANYSISSSGVLSVYGSASKTVAVGTSFTWYFFSGSTYYSRRYRFVAQEGRPDLAGLLYDQYIITAKWYPNVSNVRGSLITSSLVAVDGTYPSNGRHSDGYWYVRGSRVNESIAPPAPFTEPAPGTILLPGVSHQLTFGASPVSGATYELQRSRDEGTTWSDIAKGSTDLTRNVTEGVDASKPTIQYRVRAKNSSNVYSDWVYSEVFVLQHNVAPTLVLNTEDGKTLYENDSFIIDGSTIDSDPDQSVTVYYQINDEPRKVLTTNLSKVTIPFNKQLLFKSGKLLDGETAITGELTDGVAHTLKVWSQDSDGAESIPEIRLFYVVPNRAPTLVINDFTTEGTIDSDKFTIAGTAGDPDANSNVKVTYRINANNSVEVYNGPGGDFNFEVYFKDLKIGSNSIIVEAIDNYGAKYSKTIKLDKSEVSTPLLKSTARYKVQPPNGSAKGLLLWVRRSINLDVDVKISMTLTGEQESFVAMTLENTANITTDTVEDEFFYEVLEPKDNIILQLDLTRSSVDVDDSITLISGVLE